MKNHAVELLHNQGAAGRLLCLREWAAQAKCDGERQAGTLARCGPAHMARRNACLRRNAIELRIGHAHTGRQVESPVCSSFGACTVSTGSPGAAYQRPCHLSRAAPTPTPPLAASS
jgi:hypothetical protein